MNYIFKKIRLAVNQINVKFITISLMLLYFYVRIFFMYNHSYGIEAAEVIKSIGITIIFFMIPGYILSHFLCKISGESLIAKGFFYTLIGMPVTLFIFYLSNYYEEGIIFWLCIAASTVIFLGKAYQYMNSKKWKERILFNRQNSLIILFSIGIVLLININRPLINHKPIEIDGQKVYDSFINHDYINDISVAQLLIKNKKMQYTQYLGGKKSLWGYYSHSPIGYTLVPLIAKYAAIDPVLVFTLIVPVLLLLLLCFCTYLILRYILDDKYIALLGLILMATALPLEHFLGLSENFLNYGYIFDRHSLYLSYSFYCPRYFMGEVYILLLFYLLLRFSKEKRIGIALLIGLVLNSLFFTKETAFLGSFLSIFIAFIFHIFTKFDKKILKGGILIAILFLPIFSHHMINKETYYDPSGKIVKPAKLTFKIGVLSDYSRNGALNRQGKTIINTHLKSFVNLIDHIPDKLKIIRDMTYVILYDIARGYGVLFIFLVIGSVYAFNKNIAYTSFILFWLIMTFFENSLYVAPKNPSDIARITGLSMNNIEFMHYIAVVASFVVLGNFYLIVKRKVKEQYEF